MFSSVLWIVLYSFSGAVVYFFTMVKLIWQKKHIRQALQIDPDNDKIKSFWKSLQKSENLKGSAGQAFKDKMYEVAAGLYT